MLTVAAPILMFVGFFTATDELFAAGAFALAMSAPFVVSGWSLRGLSSVIAFRDAADTRTGWSRRICKLSLAVLLIAAVAFVGVSIGVALMALGGIVVIIAYAATMIAWSVVG